jgi:hypothetical protein
MSSADCRNEKGRPEAALQWSDATVGYFRVTVSEYGA